MVIRSYLSLVVKVDGWMEEGFVFVYREVNWFESKLGWGWK